MTANTSSLNVAQETARKQSGIAEHWSEAAAIARAPSGPLKHNS